jgi:hypothetical protein
MTFSVFQTAAFDAILFSVSLNEVALAKFGDDVACFKVIDQQTGKNVALCSLATI